MYHFHLFRYLLCYLFFQSLRADSVKEPEEFGYLSLVVYREHFCTTLTARSRSCSTITLSNSFPLYLPLSCIVYRVREQLVSCSGTTARAGK